MFNGSYQSGYGYMQPQTVVQVSGIDSARQIRLPPNSSMFALDYDQKHVYAVYTKCTVSCTGGTFNEAGQAPYGV